MIAPELLPKNGAMIDTTARIQSGYTIVRSAAIVTALLHRLKRMMRTVLIAVEEGVSQQN